MRVMFGSPVYEGVRRLGTIAGFQVDPAAIRVAGVIVMPRRPRAGQLSLALASLHVAGERLNVVPVKASGRSEPGRAVAITSATPLRIEGARPMRIRGMAFSRDTGEIRFVLSTSRSCGGTSQVPLSSAQINADEIRLPSGTPVEPDREDALINGAVRRALADDPVLRWFDASRIEAGVEDGRVRVSGFVSTEDSRTRAMNLIRMVPGVKGVDGDLGLDAHLHAAVIRALDQDPRTKGKVDVELARGVVELRGTLPYDARLAAVKIVRGVPGVREVADLLQVVAIRYQAA